MDKPRPSLLFYRPPDSIGGGAYRHFLFENRDRALREHFDVTVASSHRALRHELQQDLDAVMFFINPEVAPCQYPKKLIRELAAKNDVIKIALHNCDPFSPLRFQATNIVDALGCEAIFTADPVLELYDPFIALPTYYWPWSFSGEPLPANAQRKDHDVFVSSRNCDRAGFYIWRQANLAALSENFDCVDTDHFDQPCLGQDFIRALSRCWFGATCGSCSNTVVNKHLEIPASGTCLVTEATPLVKSMGFADMENCVFGSGKELVHKLKSLLADRPRLEGVIDAGFDVITNGHLPRHRTQIRDYVLARKSGVAANEFSQKTPFAPLIPLADMPLDWGSWREDSLPRDLKKISELSVLIGSPDCSPKTAVRRLKALRDELLPDHPDLCALASRYLLENGSPQMAFKWIEHGTMRQLSVESSLDPRTIDLLHGICIALGYRRLARRVSKLGQATALLVQPSTDGVQSAALKAIRSGNTPPAGKSATISNTQSRSRALLTFSSLAIRASRKKRRRLAWIFAQERDRRASFRQSR